MRSLLFATLIFVSVSSIFGQQIVQSNLVLVRSEDNGKMNILPCRIYIENERGRYVLPDSISIIDLSGNQVPDQIKSDFVYLFGGDTVRYTLKSGKYRVFAKTPSAEQDGYNEGTTRDWISEPKTIALTKTGIERFYVHPKSAKATYIGGWIFSGKPEEE